MANHMITQTIAGHSGLVVVLVSWTLTFCFSTNESSSVESYPYPVKEGQLYINLNPGRLSV